MEVMVLVESEKLIELYLAARLYKSRENIVRALVTDYRQCCQLAYFYAKFLKFGIFWRWLA